MTNNWFKTSNAFLSDEGKVALADFQRAIDEVLGSEEVEEMKVSEIQTLQANMGKILADTVCNILQARHDIETDKEKNPLWKLSDEEFYASLKEKYGERWMLASLTEGELNRCPKLSKKVMRQVMEDAAKDASSFVHPAVIIDPNLRYK